jgi:molecular chaperone GrpE
MKKEKTKNDEATYPVEVEINEVEENSTNLEDESTTKDGTDKSLPYEAECKEYKDKWLRTLAEFDNYRKNTLKEKQDWIKYANEKIILDLCDVLDNFERALATQVNNDNLSSYIKGVEMIFQQLNSVLKKNDVIKIEVLGKEFDPNYHEALSTLPSAEPENTIVAVIQNGYMMGERVIRPSRVAVSSGE